MGEETASLETLSLPLSLNSHHVKSIGNIVTHLPLGGGDGDNLSTDSAFCDQPSVSDSSAIIGLALKRIISTDSSFITTPTSSDPSPCLPSGASNFSEMKHFSTLPLSGNESGTQSMYCNSNESQCPEERNSHIYTPPNVFAVRNSALPSNSANQIKSPSEDFMLPPYTIGENSFGTFDSLLHHQQHNSDDFLAECGSQFMNNFPLFPSGNNTVYDSIDTNGEKVSMVKNGSNVNSGLAWPDPFSSGQSSITDSSMMFMPSVSAMYHKRPITGGSKNFRPQFSGSSNTCSKQANFPWASQATASTTSSGPLHWNTPNFTSNQSMPFSTSACPNPVISQQTNVWIQALANQKMGLAPSPMNSSNCPPSISSNYFSSRHHSSHQLPSSHGFPENHSKMKSTGNRFFPQRHMPLSKMSDPSAFPFPNELSSLPLGTPSAYRCSNISPGASRSEMPPSQLILEDALNADSHPSFGNAYNSSLLQAPNSSNNTPISFGIDKLNVANAANNGHLSPLNTLRAQLEAPLIDIFKSPLAGNPRVKGVTGTAMDDPLLMGLPLDNSMSYFSSLSHTANGALNPSSAGIAVEEKYSRKVFVGGLPPDIDEEEITTAFRRFGSLVVDWPHKAESKSFFPPKGYCFLLFQEEIAVQHLIESCIVDDGKFYWCVSSPTFKSKMVQMRPWCLSDSDYVMDDSQPLDPRRTIFVGGVPRPLTAYELAKIVDQLYGGVCYAGIDTDPELKYPKGAGRVAFSNQQSYIAAISARFVQLQHKDIDKRVEVKPYVLDDQMCDECGGSRCNGKYAPFFCANVSCLQYYCEHCWAQIHNRQGREYHKPLVKEGADRPRTVPFRW